MGRKIEPLIEMPEFDLFLGRVLASARKKTILVLKCGDLSHSLTYFRKISRVSEEKFIFVLKCGVLSHSLIHFQAEFSRQLGKKFDNGVKMWCFKPQFDLFLDKSSRVSEGKIDIGVKMWRFKLSHSLTYFRKISRVSKEKLDFCVKMWSFKPQFDLLLDRVLASATEKIDIV